MRILITGSHNFKHGDRIHQALWRYFMLNEDEPEDYTVIHGAATGADTLAGGIAGSLGMSVESYPADWNKHGKAAGPIRNQQMVDLGADVCLAFPLSDSRGTVHCMNAANRAGIPVENWGYQDIGGLEFSPIIAPPGER